MAGAARTLSDWQRVSDRVAGLALLGVGGAAMLLAAFVAVDDSCVGIGYCPTGYTNLAAVVAIVGLVAAALGTGLLLVEERERHRRNTAERFVVPGQTLACGGTIVDRYCPRCGAGSPQAAGFCHRCGGPLPAVG